MPTIPAPSAAPAAAAVELDGVTRVFGEGESRFVALHELTLRLPAGRMIGLLGRSGSGKSTLLNLVGGVDRATSGRVIVAGKVISDLSPAALALFRRRQLGYVFQAFHLLPSLTVFDNVAVPFTLDRRLDAAARAEILALLDRLGLGSKASRYPDELSGGQQQRVAIARAVVHRPAVVLADEPTGNLDVEAGAVILDLLDELRRERGITIVMATHSDDAAARCDTRLRLEDGRVVQTHGEVVLR
jgi:putative ABC transport system ATP-binding protein